MVDDSAVVDDVVEEVTEEVVEPVEEETEEESEEETTEEEAEEVEEVETDEDNEEIEDVDEIVVVGRFADVKSKYPNIVKEFPWLKNVVYKEKAYSDILPTIDDAKEAVAKAEILGNVERDLFSGNTEELLKTVKQHEPEAFNKIIDNYLEVLKKVDSSAHEHIVSNLLREAVGVIYADGKDSEDETLMKLAAELNKYFFKSTKYTPPTKLSKSTTASDDESSKLRKEREEFHNQKFESHKTEIMTRVDNQLKATIEANIDKKDVMSPYVKGKAIDDALADMRSRRDNDTRFKSTVNKLWEVARKNNFNKDSMEAIRKAYKIHSHAHLGNVIGKARAQALKTAKTVKRDEKRDKTPIRRSASSDVKSGDSSAKNDKWAGKSTMEILELEHGKL